MYLTPFMMRNNDLGEIAQRKKVVKAIALVRHQEKISASGQKKLRYLLQMVYEIGLML